MASLSKRGSRGNSRVDWNAAALTRWRWFLLTAIAMLCIGGARENAFAAGSARQRIPFQQLSAAMQNKAKACEKISKELDAANAQDRPAIARSLRDQAKELVFETPDFFLAWVWLAQAALVLDESANGVPAGANMAALGAAENRSPWIQALIMNLGKKGWISSETVAAVGSRNIEGSFGQQDKSLSGEDRLEFDTLGQLALSAEQEPDEEKRNAATEKFLARSKAFLLHHPEEMRLWLLRGHFCARDDRAEEGMEVASNIKRLGGVESNNPAIHQVMVELNLKGWLHETASTPPEVKQAAAPIPTQYPNSNPVDSSVRKNQNQVRPTSTPKHVKTSGTNTHPEKRAPTPLPDFYSG